MSTRPGASYTWDPFNQLASVSSLTNTRWSVYTAADERLLTIEPDGRGGYRERIRLRGFDNQVLREYQSACSRRLGASTLLFSDGFEAGSAGCWASAEGTPPGQPAAVSLVWVEDSIYRPGGIALSFHADGTERHYFLDHLATPRLVVSSTGAQRDYYFSPFGEQRTPPPESVDPGADPFRPTLRYAGHERDVNSVGEAADDLDAMHARYLSPLYGRFLSIDPSGESGRPAMPQSWNRYTYVASNPLKFVDPDGRDLYIVWDFTQSGLSQRDQLATMIGVRATFVRAGVRNVQNFRDVRPRWSRSGTTVGPRIRAPTDRIVRVSVSPERPADGTQGETPFITRRVTVYAGAAPAGPTLRLNYLINVGAHEVGHATGALDRYFADGTQPPYGDPGTVMQQNVSPEERGQELLDFSVDDARALQDALNAPAVCLDCSLNGGPGKRKP